MSSSIIRNEYQDKYALIIHIYIYVALCYVGKRIDMVSDDVNMDRSSGQASWGDVVHAWPCINLFVQIIQSKTLDVCWLL